MERKRAKAIRREMEEHGIGVTELACAVGISQPYLSDILNGHRRGEPVRIRIETELAKLETERREQLPAPRVRRL